MNKTIITVAVTGSQPSKSMNPNLPVTPKEIADSAYQSYEEGASIVHIHVRDPISGERSMAFHLYEEVVDLIRVKTKMIINLTTGPGGQLVVDSNNKMLADQSIMESAEKRVEHVLKLKPEMCSLDIGSMNAGPFIFLNAPPVVEKMAHLIKEAGIKPELEVFDTGHIGIANRLIRNDLISNSPHIQLCMGTGGGIPATPRMAQIMIDSLPTDATWSIFGVGKTQFPMVAVGALLGGHVRVGMEDNLYLRQGVPTTGNAELVRNAAKIVRAIGGDIASPTEARAILKLV